MTHRLQDYLPSGERVVEQIERLVSAPKKARHTMEQLAKGQRLRPVTWSKYDVTVEGSDDRLELSAYMDRAGVIRVALSRVIKDTMRIQFLRKWHSDGHHNPNCKDIDEPHMHFPTKQYPLVEGKSSFAYPFGHSINNLLTALIEVGKELNIDYQAIKLPFKLR